MFSLPRRRQVGDSEGGPDTQVGDSEGGPDTQVGVGHALLSEGLCCALWVLSSISGSTL